MTTTSYICAKCKEPNAGTRCAACGCEQFTWVGASPSAEDCTVGDLRPGERAQALEDLHGPATGKTCIPRGTAFRVESRLYSSTALVFAEDGTALRVALTGKVRRLTAAPAAPLSHEEQRAQIASAAEEAQRDPASLLPAGWPGAPPALTVEKYGDLVLEKLGRVGEHLLRAWLLTIATARFTKGDRLIGPDDPADAAHLMDMVRVVLEDMAPEKLASPFSWERST